jgi:probable HAF family extracellular repeat protein
MRFFVGPEKTSPARYEIEHLTMEGLLWSMGDAINDHGQIAGYGGTNTDECQAFVWDEETGVTNLHVPEWTESRALDINNAGQVVGVFKESSDEWFLFFWDPEDGLTEIVSYETAGISEGAYHIRLNNHGEVAGSAVFDEEDGSDQLRAFLWDRENGMKDLGTGILQGKESLAWGINDVGQVMGGYIDASGSNGAFIRDDEGGIREAETGFKGWGAFETNNAGHVAGRANESKHVCLWDGAEGTIDLTDLVAGEVGSKLVAQQSMVTGLNDSGEVVGRVWFAKDRGLLGFIPSPWFKRNFVYRSGDDVIILEYQPGLVGRSFEASDINNEGAVLVNIYTKGRVDHQVILRPLGSKE